MTIKHTNILLRRGTLLAALFTAFALAACGSSSSPLDSAPTLPAPLPDTAALPGSAVYPHASFRVTEGGSGSDAWFVFEPMEPQPRSAPLAIITHGYGEYSGYGQMQSLVEHTVMKGNVVIYPRWQTELLIPCPGPANIEPCIASTLNGIRGAMAYLAADPTRVQPESARTNYFGFSFGGIITANMLNRWQALGLPQPKSVFLDDPHDGGFTGAREPALDATLDGIPSTTLFECHSGAHGIFDDNYTGLPNDLLENGQPKRDGSCNALFPKLTSIPPGRKAIVLTSEDAYGSPALTSDHGVCSDASGSMTPDVYDTGFCRKVWDALRSCADTGTHCEYAIADTPQHRHIGVWPDGTPIIGLKVQFEAPIRADPVPARE